MLRRKISQTLREWKERESHKSLVVLGARQVGKTYSIERFGEENYAETVEINFKETPSAAGVFFGDLDVDTLVMALRFRFPDKRMQPGSTLIFLDEIQECPEALTSLKFWTQDGRYDVIASGSLLGIDHDRPSSYPVGYVEYEKMHGLDFEEFLWATGVPEGNVNTLRGMFTDHKTVPTAVNEQMMGYFRQYMATGGMPEVVARYAEDRDFRIVDRIQREILQGYLYDIVHYASPDEKTKAEKCYLSLARQLLDKENHKFQYKEVEHGGRAQKYYSSIDWLTQADIVHLCRRVSTIHYDLEDYAQDDFFRAYTTDMSLLLAMRDLALKQRIVENTLEGTTKGGLYECAVADVLYKNGYRLYFYKNEKTRREIDFIIQRDGEPIPIEVKSGNERATSLTALLGNRPDIPRAYKLTAGNVGDTGGRIITLPLYMAMFL